MSIVEKVRKNEFVSFPIYEITRNKQHKEYFSFIESTKDWKIKKTREWQFNKVKEMVIYAYEHVPFYREYYDNYNVNPHLINSWKDFEKIPCIDKQIMKEYGDLFYSDERDSIRYRVDYTGGSTGQPMKFLIDDEIYQREDAVYRSYWKDCGFKVGEKCIILRGRKIYSGSNPKIYEYNRFWNYMYLDSLYINQKLFSLYKRAIEKFNAKFIQAYPSSLLLLTKLYEVNNEKLPVFEKIFLSSENVSEEQKRYLEEKFPNAKIYNQYGHSEKAVIALQLPDGASMAFNPYYGYFELLDDDGNIIDGEGEVGEIVATGYSKSMPFIRYRTSDRASLSFETSQTYMNSWKKIKCIEGRLHEFIITKDGRRVSICTVGGAHVSELNNVIDMQYEQNEPGELIIKVIYKDKMSNETKKKIEMKFEELFNKEVNCHVHQVDVIERTARNKKMMLIQNIKE